MLLRWLLDGAKAELAKQEEAFEVFTVQQADHVEAWRVQVEKFEQDGTSKNPYEAKIKGLFLLVPMLYWLLTKLRLDRDASATAVRRGGREGSGGGHTQSS